MRHGGSSAGGGPSGDVGRLAIGSLLRETRQSQGLSINAVAEATGLTKGFLSRLERDEVSASVASLLRVCQTLGLTMGELFDAPPLPLVPPRGRGRITLGGFGVQEQVLSAANPHLLVIHSLIEAGGSSGAEPHALDATTEFAYVVSGRLDVRVGNEHYRLAAGDALTFPARVPHQWENVGPEPVEVLWTLALSPR
jgi:transcriptional regulator with XRE-family HTH domain